MKDKKTTRIVSAVASFMTCVKAEQAGADKAIARATAPKKPTPEDAAAGKKPAKASRKPRKAAGGPKLAPLIDNYLIKGGYTAGEIAGLIEAEARAAGMDTKGKDLKANVRARMIHHRKKKATVVRAEDGKIKVTPAAAA